MIIVRLAGGLGNQIFQLGACLLLAQKSGLQKIIIDDSALNSYSTARKNDLLNIFDFSKIELKIKFENVKIVKLRLPRLFPLNIPKYPFVSDKNFQTILSNPNRFFMILDGYFQKCLNQDDFNKEIFLIKNILRKEFSKEEDKCIIHIRGRDFIKLGWNSIASLEYYIKAIETMQKKYFQKKFWVVTDDFRYANDLLVNTKIDYDFIGNNLQEDFYQIGCFKYRILSSSTFAFWASALGSNQRSVVIVPKYWKPNCKRKIVLPNEHKDP